MIELALSMICDRNSPECFVSVCPIDDATRMLWMTSVVASPNTQPTYTVLSASQIHDGVSCCHHILIHVRSVSKLAFGMKISSASERYAHEDFGSLFNATCD